MIFTTLFAAIVIPTELSNQIPSSVISELIAAVPSCTEPNTDLNSLFKLIPTNILVQLPSNLNISPQVISEITSQIPVCNIEMPSATSTIATEVSCDCSNLNTAIEVISDTLDNILNPETTQPCEHHFMRRHHRHRHFT